MVEINLMRHYPRTQRKLTRPRALDPINAAAALRFGREYFDGSREQGYGGYRYDGRWIPIALDIVEHFGLKAGQRVLDVGCAKGFLVKDLMDVCPGLEVFGLDISEYAITNCVPEAKGRLVLGSADALPFGSGSFAAVVSINTLHNLERSRLITALQETERLSPGRSYVQVDAYHNDAERDFFLGWCLTAKTFLKPADWRALFAEAGYHGDYHWTVLEMDPSVNDFGASGAGPNNNQAERE
ncbi:MAG: class I SAM-dependent methyltransferase [Hyphomicrobium sp.]|nr:MAG: class I SAM-dependent methyltransferase [Hyphomicrobium sp.]MBZ0211756.1 class I SAM-dependent methyltransferase [Hyphomicrobium sp.]